MAAVDARATAFLSLDALQLAPDRSLARRLPGELARRYRALPIAQDNGCITVAMADPSDQVARQALAAALTTDSPGSAAADASLYVVQGDPVAIDAWLSELWPEKDAPLQSEVWLPEPFPGDQQMASAYAANLAALLQATLQRFDLVAGRDCGLAAAGSPVLGRFSSDALLVLPCSDDTLRGRWLGDTAGQRPAVLIACQPRWPLRKLLVIVRGDQVDDQALAWAARLAHPSGAAATALMVAPQGQAGHALALRGALHHEPAEAGIAALLSTGNAAGRKLQQVAQRLAALQLDGTLHLRQGAPEAVIRDELAAAPYDLAITGLAVRGWEARWRLRPFLDKLLQDTRCPLLIAR